MLQIRYVNVDKPSLWLVGPLFKIGSQRDTQINLPGAEPVVLELSVADQDVEIKHCTSSVKHNGEVAEVGAKLASGDTLEFEGIQAEIYDPKNIARDATKIRTVQSDCWYIMGMGGLVLHKRFDLKSPMVLGRSPDVEISIPHEQLSRKHIKLTPTPKGLKLEDLQSANGTFVNGKKVQHALLTSGSQIQLDTLVFRVYGPATKAPDTDATKLRGNDDSDKAAKPAVKPSQPKKTQPTTPAAAPTAPVSKPSVTAKHAPEPKKKRSSLIWILGLFVLVGAAAAVYHFYPELIPL